MISFKEFTMSTASPVAGLPPDDPPVDPKKKKKKYKMLTRKFIEVAGKRKRLSK